MNMAPGFSRASSAVLISPRVSGLSARCTLRMSQRAATSAGEGARATGPTPINPSSWASASVRGRSWPSKRRLQRTISSPNAAARRITSRAMLPAPSRPRVWPCRPCAFEYSFLFHWPARRSATLSATRRSSARISARVSSATAMAFLPGQFDT